MYFIRTVGSSVSPKRMALALQPLQGILTSRGGERLGICYGLPIDCCLIELHGGKLEVTGPDPDDSNIILTLPGERLL